MKTLPLFLLLLGCFQTWGVVKSARIARQAELGYHEVDTRYASHDFAEAFRGLNLAQDGEETEDGVFGRPIQLVVKSDEGDFLLIVNNTEGVFSIYPLRRSGRKFKSSTKGSRDVRLPALYRRLKSAGLNILTEDDLKRVQSLPRSERRQFFRSYRPVSR